MNLVKGVLKNAMENVLFIISHLVMLCCATLVFYNSAEAKTMEVKVTSQAFKADKVAKPLVEKIGDEELVTELELRSRLLQA